MRSGLATLTVAALAACVTTKDTIGGGDARLDESSGRDPATAAAKSRTCGAEEKGDIVLIDARTGGPVTCLAVSLSREPMSCPLAGDCTSDLVFKGFTNARGQVPALGAFDQVRLIAVADGYSPSYLFNATLSASKVLELELVPDDSFWLKVLDGDGNYLQDLLVTFKQGDEVLAQLRTNVLANVFFTQRQPFAGQAVTVEAQGYQAATVGPADLGEDGHSLTLRK